MSNAEIIANLAAKLDGKVTGADVPMLAHAVESVFADIVAADYDPQPVADYLTEPDQQFVASRVITGGDLSHNPATAKSLLGALEALSAFYAAELAPVPV